MSVELVGYAGFALMASCLIFQLVKTFKDGHAKGLALGYLLTATTGMITLLVYVCLTSKSVPLIANYSINAMSFITLLIYKFRS